LQESAASSNEQQERYRHFAEKPCHLTSHHIKILGTVFSFAPNTMLKQNIFITKDEQPAIIEKIMHMPPTSVPKKRLLFQLPEQALLTLQPQHTITDHTEESNKRSKLLEDKLVHFGVKGNVTTVKPGPIITMFEYKPEIDSKISKIVALEDDLAMALTAHSIRIIAPIPGKNAVGFEIANNVRSDVLMSTVLHSKEWESTKARLPLMLGVDVVGNPIIQDLVSMPHLLVGGATGSGKSVGLNVMLSSLLCKLTPDVLKLILIDPKRLEFTPYADIPHLLFPIVTQPTRAVSVLKWVVHEMEQRYELMARLGVRNVSEYHAFYKENKTMADGTSLKPISFLVVIIDELADLMMVGGKDVETNIVRIAQMARASGIHMIVATQRPSVDIVTGLIKVNFPSRIAFRVSSKIDSRTILDLQGAEKLLGRGDMLFMHSSSPELKRVHGAYASDEEIEIIAQFWRDQGKAAYLDIEEAICLDTKKEFDDVDDELYQQVREFLQHNDEISISMIQRQYRIGFNRSARIIEKLEMEGLIAPAQGSKPRKVLR
jgi:S-DNA-T family DNA segregation ATPase FtsK/SpoIIIE